MTQAISQSRYLGIRTAGGVSTGVERRKMCGLVITPNALAPFNMVVEMDSADEVRRYFGMDSSEYGFAQVYFSATGYNGKKPDCIAFTRWCPDGASGERMTLSSQVCELDVAEFRRLAGGSCRFQVRTTEGEYEIELSRNAVSAVTTLSGFCALVNAGLRSDSFPSWLNASALSYGGGRFIFTYGDGVVGEALPFGDSPVSSLLGFDEASEPVVSLPVVEDGGRVGAIRRISSVYDDFGSFCFLDTANARSELNGRAASSLNRLGSVREVDAWLATESTRFMHVCGFSRYHFGMLRDSGLSMATHWVLFERGSLGYEEAEAMGLFSTIDYSSENEAEYSWMFRENQHLTAIDVSDADAATYTELSLNFYGRTQRIGRDRLFYQPGQNADGTDTSVYCSAIWLKDAIQTAIANRFLKDEKVDLSSYGIGLIGDDIVNVMREAIANKTIVVPETLTNVQKIAINQVFDNAKAYLEVERDGYCLSLSVRDGVVEYVLVYHKNGNIRKINGTHVIKGT